VKLTDKVIAKALDYLPDRTDLETPFFDFDLLPQFTHLSCRVVSGDERRLAANQLTEAFFWCQRRFPLRLRAADGSHRASIRRFVVGYSTHKDELLSASSAQVPGMVLMAAQWPLTSIYRLASLVAHESMHQALYERERLASPVRNASLGYSPWKYTLRPGRLVWHAFWTFACQFTLLAEAATEEPELLMDDPELTRFLADMAARVCLCSESMMDFEIVSDDEARRCGDALLVVQSLCEELRDYPGYSEAATHAENEVFRDYEAWSHSLVKSPPPGLATA
jgi:hypothetical protein